MRNARADAVPPTSVRSIYATLRQDVVTLRLRPGARLSENELALRFGTSRAPVREALIRLVEEGLIEVLPQRGSFVSRISLRSVERARFVREALEIAIGRRAADRGISAAVHDEIEEAIAQQLACDGDPERFTQTDDAFHRGLAKGAGLLDVWAVLEREKVQFDRVRFLSLPSVTPVEVLVTQHRAILAAVDARAPAAAEAAIREHLSEVLKVVDRLATNFPDLIRADD